MALSNRNKLKISVALFLFAPFALEGLVRLRAHLRYGAAQDIEAVYHMDPVSGLKMPIPGLSMFLAKRSQIDIDSRGFRSPEVELPKSVDRMRFAFLGGSTTFCGQARSTSGTWPHLLVDKLRTEFPGVQMDYLNAGVTGASVADSIRSMQVRLRPLDPDIVVIYHTAKDFADDTRVLALEEGLVALAEHDALEEYSLLWRLLKLNLWYLESQQSGASSEGKLAYEPATISPGFKERLTTLVRTAQETADVVVLCTFTTKARREQPREEQLANMAQSFTFTPYLSPEGILDGFEEYARVVVEVAGETGAILVEGAEEIPGTAEYFSDSVHFTEQGYAAMAQRVHARLHEHPQFTALLEETWAQASRETNRESSPEAGR